MLLVLLLSSLNVNFSGLVTLVEEEGFFFKSALEYLSFMAFVRRGFLFLLVPYPCPL